METPEPKPRKEEDSEQLKPPALWYRPPAIVPNYGAKSKRNNMLPKSKIQHVLLHDNKNQKNILESKVRYMSHDFKRSARLSDLHKRSFLVRQSMKQVGLWQKGIDHVQLLPEVVVQLHCPGNSKETAMQSAAARRQSVTKAELQAMFKDYDPGSLDLKSSESFQIFQAHKPNIKNKVFSRGTSMMSMTDMNKHRAQSETVESPLRTGLARENTVATASKGTHRLASVHGLSPTQSFFYNRSKTAVPKMESGLTRKFSTYNFVPRRQLTAVGADYAYERAADDPRFKGLKKQLIPPDKPIDGFIQLSPCGPKIIQKYGCSHYNPKELAQLLEKYNDVSFMSTRKIRNAQREEEGQRHRLLPTQEAFVGDEDDDRNSLYSSAERSSSDSVSLDLH